MFTQWLQQGLFCRSIFGLEEPHQYYTSARDNNPVFCLIPKLVPIPIYYAETTGTLYHGKNSTCKLDPPGPLIPKVTVSVSHNLASYMHTDVVKARMSWWKNHSLLTRNSSLKGKTKLLPPPPPLLAPPSMSPCWEGRRFRPEPESMIAGSVW